MRLRKELKSRFNYVELFFMFLITIKQESSQRGWTGERGYGRDQGKDGARDEASTRGSRGWWELITVGPRSTGAALVSVPFSIWGRSFVNACADSRGRNTILHGNAEGLCEERNGNREISRESSVRGKLGVQKTSVLRKDGPFLRLNWLCRL